MFRKAIDKNTLRERLSAALPILKEMAKVEDGTWRSMKSLFTETHESRIQSGVKTIGESFIKRLFG